MPEYEHQEQLTETIFETPTYYVSVLFNEKEGQLEYGVTHKKYDVVEASMSCLAAAIATCKYHEDMLFKMLSPGTTSPMTGPVGKAN